MAKAKAGPRRMTNAEREQQIAKHPETDTRPRYGDGTLMLPNDTVRLGDATGRLFWATRTQDVPSVAYDAVVEGIGTVPLKGLHLVERHHP